MALACVYMAYRIIFFAPAVDEPKQNPDLFGGMAPEAGGLGSGSGSNTEDQGSAARGDDKPNRITLNPVNILQKKLQALENAGGRVQVTMDKIACAMESFNSAFTLDDYVITVLFLVGTAGAIVVLWLIPFWLIMTLLGCFLLRPERFRDPLPPKPLCLVARLPNKSASVTYAKG